MGTHEMEHQVKELRELRRMAEELAAEIETIQNAIKAEMAAQAVDTMTGSDWKITWKDVTTSRLDAGALRKALPDVAERFTKTSTTRRFTLAA